MVTPAALLKRNVSEAFVSVGLSNATPTLPISEGVNCRGRYNVAASATAPAPVRTMSKRIKRHKKLLRTARILEQRSSKTKCLLDINKTLKGILEGNCPDS